MSSGLGPGTKKLDRLPLEILNKICSKLTKNDVLSLCLTSKAFLRPSMARLYHSITIIDSGIFHDSNISHLEILGFYYNKHSTTTTVVKHNLELLIRSLLYLNRENIKLIKEVNCFSNNEMSYRLVEKLMNLLALKLSLKRLCLPVFTEKMLKFDQECITCLSISGTFNHVFANTDEALSCPNLESLHLRSALDSYWVHVLDSIKGYENVKTLKLSGNSIDDDYDDYVHQGHAEEIESFFRLSSIFNDHKVKFKNLKTLIFQKMNFQYRASEFPFLDYSLDLSFINFENLEGLVIVECGKGCLVDISDKQKSKEGISKIFNQNVIKNLKLFIYENGGGLFNKANISQMEKLEKLHLSKSNFFKFNEMLKTIKNLKNLTMISYNDEDLIKHFCDIISSQFVANDKFSQRFLTDYQFKPTTPRSKYSSKELNYLFNSYQIATDYFNVNFQNDINPFEDLYFNDKSFINQFFKEVFKPFKDEIIPRFLPLASKIFETNSNITYVKICAIGFKYNRKLGTCYMDN
ncbi:hypothetical protein PACTADRAFT_47469 [Pachysolen tannophilus NRRL Y-2460]|uniref:F-box domain-containing protein n=1 Tax=Pachysolen tannophilus NRRL Y-2460 TaxID=669874 RepID=A0A1E4U0R0_PACTA|nr:hypothetical protein PACTADRAFT_47469 [Pachysolen tannophilus NRRL Y-2460]